jgi:hypothetical protein
VGGRRRRAVAAIVDAGDRVRASASTAPGTAAGVDDDRPFEIEFLDAGVDDLVFTFG